SKQGYFIITNFSHVCSNIDCSREDPDVFYELLKELMLFKDSGYEMVDLFPTFKHTGVFIAIDEAHLYFSSDMYKRYSQPKFQYIIKLLAQARKADIEIELSVQVPDKIDINWRRYIEEYINYKPMIPWRIKVPV